MTPGVVEVGCDAGSRAARRTPTYADVSTSGTGVHIVCRGTLPEDVKAIDASLPTHDAFPDAGIEVYDAGRYMAMIGQHIASTPAETRPAQEFAFRYHRSR